MAKHSKASEAREGLIDSVKGKAKEIVGAITDNDSLIEEGQLQHAAAKERRAANNAEAIAAAEAKEARQEAAQAHDEAAQSRDAVQARTTAVENAVDLSQAAQKQSADQAGRHAADRAVTRAELDAQGEVARAESEENAEVGAAVADVADAVVEHREAVDQAADTKAAAARWRAEADRISDDIPENTEEKR